MIDVPLTPEQRAARDERLARQTRDQAAAAERGRLADAERAAELARRSPPSEEVRRRIRERVVAAPLPGCVECRDKVATGRHEPFLEDSIVMQTRLWRCSACGTYWEETQRSVYALTADEVAEVYGPDVAGRRQG